VSCELKPSLGWASLDSCIWRVIYSHNLISHDLPGWWMNSTLPGSYPGWLTPGDLDELATRWTLVTWHYWSSGIPSIKYRHFRSLIRRNCKHWPLGLPIWRTLNKLRRKNCWGSVSEIFIRFSRYRCICLSLRLNFTLRGCGHLSLRLWSKTKALFMTMTEVKTNKLCRYKLKARTKWTK